MFHWQVETSLNKYGNTFKRDFYNSSPFSSTQTLPSHWVGWLSTYLHEKVATLTNIKSFFFSLICTFLLYSDQHKGLYLFFQESLDLGRKIYILSHFLNFGFLTTAFLFPLLVFWLTRCSKDNWINERKKKSTITPIQWKGSVLQALWEPLDNATSHSDSLCALISIWDLLLQRSQG